MSSVSSIVRLIFDSAQTVITTVVRDEASAIYQGLFAQRGVFGTMTMLIGTTSRLGLETGLFVHDAGPAAFLTAGQAALHAGQAAFNASILDARQVGRDMRLGTVLAAAPRLDAADALAQKATDAAAKKAAAKKATDAKNAEEEEEEEAAVQVNARRNPTRNHGTEPAAKRRRTR
jgi:hypothetical protein